MLPCHIFYLKNTTPAAGTRYQQKKKIHVSCPLPIMHAKLLGARFGPNQKQIWAKCEDHFFWMQNMQNNADVQMFFTFFKKSHQVSNKVIIPLDLLSVCLFLWLTWSYTTIKSLNHFKLKCESLIACIMSNFCQTIDLECSHHTLCSVICHWVILMY